MLLLLLLLFLRLLRQGKTHVLKTERWAWQTVWELPIAGSWEGKSSLGPHQRPALGLYHTEAGGQMEGKCSPHHTRPPAILKMPRKKNKMCPQPSLERGTWEAGSAQEDGQ